MKREIELGKNQIALAQAQKPDAQVNLSPDMETQVGAALHAVVARQEAAMQQQDQVLGAALQSLAQSQQAMVQAAQMIAQAVQLMNAPRQTKLVRDETGRPIGAETTPVTVQ